MKDCYLVKYVGPFGFIKPWTAVRDGETFSQQFLTPSIVEGVEKKIFPHLLSTNGIQKIIGHRLSYNQISLQQEVIQTRGWNSTRKENKILFKRPRSILIRGVLIDPVLYLAFRNEEDAKIAFSQHICLCRNEDILLPEQIKKESQQNFKGDETYNGYELVFEKNENSFHVGFDRQTKKPMIGWLKTVGVPVKTIY